MKAYPPVETFISLRRWIGYVGISLPWMVWLLASWKLQPSISDFYYTCSRNWFVGSLVSIGAFLGSYYGYDLRDRIMSLAAGGCAFGVALCPTDSGATTMVGGFHYFFAAVLFALLACISGFQFTQTSGPKRDIRGNKRRRNLIYVTCAWIICAALVLILLGKVTSLSVKFSGMHPVFWLEAAALEAFGFSWMLKGEFILRDERPGGEEPVRFFRMRLSRALVPRF